MRNLVFQTTTKLATNRSVHRIPSRLPWIDHFAFSALTERFVDPGFAVNAAPCATATTNSRDIVDATECADWREVMGGI